MDITIHAQTHTVSYIDGCALSDDILRIQLEAHRHSVEQEMTFATQGYKQRVRNHRKVIVAICTILDVEPTADETGEEDESD
jgi:hypothetical protein